MSRENTGSLQDLATLSPTKKAEIRCALLVAYSLESADKVARIKAIVDLVSHVKYAIDQESPDNGEFIYSVFRGTGDSSLAETRPEIGRLADSKEIRVYIGKFILDIIHKAVKGTYPEGNGISIHDQPQDESIRALTNEELGRVFSELAPQHTQDKLISFGDIAKLINMKIQPQHHVAIFRPNFLFNREERQRLFLSITIGALIGGAASVLSRNTIGQNQDQDVRNQYEDTERSVGQASVGAVEGSIAATLLHIVFRMLQRRLRRQQAQPQVVRTQLPQQRIYIHFNVHKEVESGAVLDAGQEPASSSSQQPEGLEAGLHISSFVERTRVIGRIEL